MKTTLGVLGYGQLGQMLGLSAYSLGVPALYWDMKTSACYAELPPAKAEPIAIGDEGWQYFTDRATHYTVETENTPVELLESIPRLNLDMLIPTLGICQHRLREKETCRSLGIGTTAFAPAYDAQSLQEAYATIGGDCILKTTTMGYDGKGQWSVASQDELTAIENKVTYPLIVEQKVPFAMECSLLVAVANKEIVFYPLMHNTHREGILRKSTPLDAQYLGALQPQAEKMAKQLILHFQCPGVLTIEFFVTREGKLLVNELAPRVHNSGHLTIEAFNVSQFEQHVRGVAGFGLLPVRGRVQHAAMLNLIGQPYDEQLLRKLPAAHLHWYGKEILPNRKVGHITVATNDKAEFDETVAALEASMND